MATYRSIKDIFTMARLSKIYLGVACTVAAATLLTSCIRDGANDCRVSVSFDYSHNILSANAFEGQVDEVTLYVFDEDGILIDKHTGAGDAISNDLRIEFDNLETGRYRFVAWGRSDFAANENADFEIPDMTVGESGIESLQYRLRLNAGVQSDELNNFLVGVADAQVRRAPGVQSVRVELKKVTRRIRVVILPYSGGSDLDVNDYSFRIEDPVGNGLVNYDFSLLEDAPVTYRPYYKANIIPAAGDLPSPSEIDRAIAVEIASSRLMVSNNPRLYISNSDETREIVNISLPWLFSLTEMESHRNWSLQEYLDRQDEFVITFFFDNDQWMNATVIINGWVVNNLIIN